MGYSLKKVTGYKVIGKAKVDGVYRYLVETSGWDHEVGADLRWISINKLPYILAEGMDGKLVVNNNPLFHSGILKKASRGKYVYHIMGGPEEWLEDTVRVTDEEYFDRPWFTGLRELIERPNFEELNVRDKVWIIERREWEKAAQMDAKVDEMVWMREMAPETLRRMDEAEESERRIEEEIRLADEAKKEEERKEEEERARIAAIPQNFERAVAEMMAFNETPAEMDEFINRLDEIRRAAVEKMEEAEVEYIRYIAENEPGEDANEGVDMGQYIFFAGGTNYTLNVKAIVLDWPAGPEVEWYGDILIAGGIRVTFSGHEKKKSLFAIVREDLARRHGITPAEVQIKD